VSEAPPSATPGANGDTPNGGDPESEQGTSVAERALELLVYAPAGLVVSVIDDLPTFVDRGRTSVGVQLGNARLLGEFALRKARRDLSGRVGQLNPHRGTAAPPSGDPAKGPESTEDDSSDSGSTEDPESAGTEASSQHPEPRTARATAPSDHLAIFDYETLSASQVVRRLDGLGPDELEAVYRHEAASRRRRTILHRAQQLLEEQTGPDPSTPTV